MRRLAIMMVATLGVAACAGQPEHAEWRQVCVASHSDTRSDLLFFPNGQGGMSMIPTVVTEEVCDAWGRRCVPGRDGSTTCPSH